ncbi:MAG: hypothetical protein ACK493_03425 [Planctomycetota bacterium]
MSDASSDRIWNYLDGSLSPEEQVRLEDWLKQAEQNCDEFAQVAQLHDRFRNFLGVEQDFRETPAVPDGRGQVEAVAGKRLSNFGRWSIAVLTLGALLGGILLLWPVSPGSGLQAAGPELQKLSSWSNRETSRSFRVQVLADQPEPAKGRRSREDAAGKKPEAANPRQSAPEAPPKPSLEGALLHTRGTTQFVLDRLVPGKGRFLTGSDGSTGWAMSPDGPTRVSADPQRFNRDVPGHEHRFPLNRLFGNLDELESAYRIQLFLAERSQDEQLPTSLLVATKRKGQRGPERIEVTFESMTGRILEMRFIAMPYGPRRVDLGLNLISEGDLGPEYFGYPAHQAADATVVKEEE